jgi:hypothetical protein
LSTVSRPAPEGWDAERITCSVAYEEEGSKKWVETANQIDAHPMVVMPRDAVGMNQFRNSLNFLLCLDLHGPPLPVTWLHCGSPQKLQVSAVFCFILLNPDSRHVLFKLPFAWVQFL